MRSIGSQTSHRRPIARPMNTSGRCTVCVCLPLDYPNAFGGFDRSAEHATVTPRTSPHSMAEAGSFRVVRASCASRGHVIETQAAEVALHACDGQVERHLARRSGRRSRLFGLTRAPGRVASPSSREEPSITCCPRSTALPSTPGPGRLTRACGSRLALAGALIAPVVLLRSTRSSKPVVISHSNLI